MPSQPSQPTVSSLTVRTHETFIMRQLQDCYNILSIVEKTASTLNTEMFSLMLLTENCHYNM